MKKILSCILILILLSTFCNCARNTPEEIQSDITTITLSAVGDIFLTNEMIADARTPQATYDFTTTFAGVCTTLNKADFTVGNFEATIAGEPFNEDSNSLPLSIADSLHTAGFDLLQISNSMTFKNGITGMQSTYEALENASILPLGVNAGDNNRIILKDVNGVKIAFIAFTKGFNGMSLPDGMDNSVYLLYTDYDSSYSRINTSVIKNAVQAASSYSPDLIVAMVHWGSENQQTVSDNQKTIANLLVSNGVDIILGSHSHRVEKVETKTVSGNNGINRQVVIAYGLGDFCKASSELNSMSAILNIEIKKDCATNITVVSNVSYTPVATTYNGPNVSNKFSVIDASTAISQYENNYYLKISKSAYEYINENLTILDEALFPTDENNK